MTRATPLRRWNLVRHLHNNLWLAWRGKYLQSFQARIKWTRTHRNFQVGDIVLIKDESLLDRTWPMAIVTRVYPGKDRLVRVVNIRTRGKTYKHATDRLVLLLPAGDDGGDRWEHVRALIALSSEN